MIILIIKNNFICSWLHCVICLIFPSYKGTTKMASAAQNTGYQRLPQSEIDYFKRQFLELYPSGYFNNPDGLTFIMRERFRRFHEHFQGLSEEERERLLSILSNMHSSLVRIAERQQEEGEEEGEGEEYHTMHFRRFVSGDSAADTIPFLTATALMEIITEAVCFVFFNMHDSYYEVKIEVRSADEAEDDAISITEPLERSNPSPELVNRCLERLNRPFDCIYIETADYPGIDIMDYQNYNIGPLSPDVWPYIRRPEEDGDDEDEDEEDYRENDGR